MVYRRFAKLIILSLLLGFSNLQAIYSQSQEVFNHTDRFLQGRRSVVVPFQYINNFIVIECHLFGIMTGFFILDTGAENLLLLDRNYTDVAQVTYERKIPIMGSDLSRQLYALLTRKIDFQIHQLPVNEHDVLVLEENNLHLDEVLGIHIAGIIGGSVFRGMVMQINYQRNEITLYDPEFFKPPVSANEIKIHMKAQKPYAYATTSIGNEAPFAVELLVDTGSGIPLLLHSNTHQSMKLPDHLVKGLLGNGLGGPLEGSMGRISSLNFEGIQFHDVISGFQDIDSLFLESQERFRNGLIGNDILNRFHLYIDFASERLWLKPVRRYQKPFIMDRSGIIFLAHGRFFNRFVVTDVIENSPGALAGVLPGDEVRKLQGLKNEHLTLEKIGRIMQAKPGKKIRMTLKRNREIINTSLILKDLI